MKLEKSYTAAELAATTGAELIGDGSIRVTGLNEIHHVGPGDLCFVDHPKYYDATLASAAAVILIDKPYPCPPGKALLVTPEPFAVYDGLVRSARPQVPWRGRVDPSARLGEGTRVAPGAVVGPGVVTGRDCYLGPNAVLADGVRLGDRVYVGAGTVVGEEAFYFQRRPEGLHPWTSGGTVHLEDDVSLGPNCTIARGISSPTTIGRGTRIDALVQVGHDCRIGAHCLLAAQVGIAGNTRIGDWCVLLGQVGVAQNLTIGDRAMIYAKSGVSKDLAGGKHYFGVPAQEARDEYRDLATLRGLRKG